MQDNSSAVATAPILSTAEVPTATTRFIAGYVVVSRWVSTIGAPDEMIQYDHYNVLNDAADAYTEYQNGEFPRATAVGIFPCDERGLPIGGRLDPVRLMALVAETRRA